MKFQKLANVDVSLRFLQQEKIPLVNISAVDIVDGKIGLTLGLVWTIILRYHIQKKGVPSAQKQDLIDWVNSMIAPLHISNLTKRCTNFLAFAVSYLNTSCENFVVCFCFQFFGWNHFLCSPQRNCSG
jgi:hypothetical protein